jgi:pimeloyl-ACP methyl ester carboxylesterase
MVWTAASVLLAIIAGLAALIYASFLAARYFFVPRFPDEIHFATTTDGWRIAVLRYRPAAEVPGRNEPVLLVHGIAANRYNFDFADDRSLARHLSRAGFDTFLVELRGRGWSTRPRLFSGVHYDWSFDEYAERDLPAAVHTVLAASGRKRLHLVGFSTGALACYAFLSDAHRTAEVASLVALAGPSTFRRASKALSGGLIRKLRWLRHRWLMRVLAPLSGYLHPSPLQIIYNPENTEGTVQRRAMVNLICNFSRNELLQYSDWISNDVFRSIDQRRDYRSELSRIVVPSLFLAGPRDALAPPDAVKEAHDSVGAADKQFQICSRAQGLKVNYGHFDLLIGRDAPTEVYPLVAGWLTAHDSLSAEKTAPPTAPRESSTPA